MTFQDRNITGNLSQEQMLGNARAIDSGLGISQGSERTLRTLGQGLGHVIREYPGPSLMIGAGLAWMLVSREQKKIVPLPDRLRHKATHRKEQLLDAAGHAKEQVLDTATGVREQIRDAAHDAKEQTLESYEEAKQSAAERMSSMRLSARESLDHAKESLHHRAESARGAYDNLLDDHPLILGAVAVALGLAVGLLLPATEKEDQMMGSTRDGLLDQARAIVDDARKAAVESLRAGADSVKSHLTDAAEEAKATLEDSVLSAKDAVKEHTESGEIASELKRPSPASESF